MTSLIVDGGCVVGGWRITEICRLEVFEAGPFASESLGEAWRKVFRAGVITLARE